MHWMTYPLAFVAAVSPACAQSAEIPALFLHDTGGAERRPGIGVQVGASIPLGRSGSRKPSAAIFELRAGPAVTRVDEKITWRPRTTIAPLAAIALAPHQSVTVSLAREPVAVAYPQRLTGGRATVPFGEKQNISTAGSVAIGVGVVLLVGTLLFVDALNDASE